VSNMYREAKYEPLIEDPALRADFESLNMNLLTRRHEEFRARAAQALLDGAAIGLRVGVLPREEHLPLAIVKEHEDWEAINAALRAEPPAQPAGESIYDELMLLVNVVEGSPAEAAGLRRFDQIVQVDGVKVRSTEEFLAKWTSIPEGSEVKFLVRRLALKDGSPMPVTGTDGKPTVDDNGMVTWQAEEFIVTIKRAYMGVNLGQGMLPPRFAR
jgi:membrane-associated protease RseP (regulator of RpoE activity)